MAFVSLLTFGG